MDCSFADCFVSELLSGKHIYLQRSSDPPKRRPNSEKTFQSTRKHRAIRIAVSRWADHSSMSSEVVLQVSNVGIHNLCMGSASL